ncbi:unnamed protein product [Ilex paraguariensis]|uniref:Uncharacterized protein n=1 Tax=Ilex paraguariensis TaxID=185542 RepID=A0ABC8SF85_9AQUA
MGFLQCIALTRHFNPTSIEEKNLRWVDKVLKQLSQSPSSVTWACDPSGGIKVMEHWVKPDGRIRCCNCWSARSKHRAEPRCSGEGWSVMAPREEGNA